MDNNLKNRKLKLKEKENNRRVSTKNLMSKSYYTDLLREDLNDLSNEDKEKINGTDNYEEMFKIIKEKIKTSKYRQYKAYLKKKYEFEEPSVLMLETSSDMLIDIVNELGLKNLSGTIDMFHNLMWYLSYSLGPYDNNLNNKEKEYVSGLSEQQLGMLSGEKYKGPSDKASMIFAILSGESPRTYGILRHYEEVKKFNPIAVWILYEQKYVQFDISRKQITDDPPYVALAKIYEKSNIPAEDKIAGAATVHNIDRLIKYYRIAMSPIIVTPREKVIYFIKEIMFYKDILSRAENVILPPPLLHNKPVYEIKNVINKYTSLELLDGYEPLENWENMLQIKNEALFEFGNETPVWKWRHTYCSNDDTENLTDFIPHGEINKDNPEDPTVSFGYPRNYRCYQVSELITMFGYNDDGFFKFSVPDYNPLNPMIDPVTRTQIAEEFSIDDIENLLDLLKSTKNRSNLVNVLISKILEGFEEQKNASKTFSNIKSAYNKLTEEEKNLFDVYISWSFLYSLWLRNWKGPGFDFVMRNEHHIDKNVYINIQHTIRGLLLLSIEQYPLLYKLIDGLPLIKYDFLTSTATIGKGDLNTITDVMNAIQEGRFCMAQGSDLIHQTMYYLIKIIVNDDFSTFIAENVNMLINMELDIINNKLFILNNIISKDVGSTSDDINREIKTLHQRKNIIISQNGKYKHDDFVYRHIGETGHVDPNFLIKF